MSSLLDDAAFVEDDDLVRPPDGGDAMGDEDSSPGGHDLLQPVENRLLRARVDAGHGVVENENPRRADHRPCQGRALLLAS